MAFLGVEGQWWNADAPVSRLSTTSPWRLVSIRRVRGNVPVVKAAVHCLAADQHLSHRLLILLGSAGFRGALQIDLPGYDGDDHNDDTDAAGSGHKLKVSCHGNRTELQEVMGGETTRKCHKTVLRHCGIDTAPVSLWWVGLAQSVAPHRA